MSEDQTNRIAPGLETFYLLGRSGLRVSPLCLGTMTFGNANGWGCDEATSKAIVDRYREAGGNFLDTADMYVGGESERIVGRLLKASRDRDRVVVATKFTFNGNPDDPNGGGNGRKHMIEACEASLRRLQTDYIDLYWMHAWDGLTPVEEVMETLAMLVRQGKIRYAGLSDVPAWYAARAQTYAECHGLPRLIALQLEYSLTERSIEREFVDAAHELGLGICPWSPLCGGLLTGKYTRESVKQKTGDRLSQLSESANPVWHKFTERNFQIVDALLEVAKEIGRSPAQVAINWATRRPGIVSTILGARKLEQLEDNLAALDFEIPAELHQKLDEAGRPEPGFPYMFFTGHMRGMVYGKRPVAARPPWY